MMNKEDADFEDIVDCVDGKTSLILKLGSEFQIDGVEDDEEFTFTGNSHTAEDDKFDEVVGTLQEILIDPKFEKLQKQFFDKHCLQFEATEENKLVYTSIFKQYQNEIEKFITQRLSEEIADFNVETFMT